MNGLLLIDKPPGPTSHDVVARARRALGERRIGHTGTLDPSATGLLPLVVGPATRLARFLSGTAKRYEAEIRLGVATDTGDAEGLPVGGAYAGPWPARETIEAALAPFRGTFLQQPPAFSAKKVEGRRSYAAARAARHGAAPAPPSPAPAQVSVHALDLLDAVDGRILLRIECSAGFYVRALAQALGEGLGTGAHLAALRRTRSGEWDVADALPLERIERAPEEGRLAIIAPARMLGAWPAVVLNGAGVRRAAHGQELGPWDSEAGAGTWPTAAAAATRLLSPDGELVGMAEPSATPGLLHPSVVLG